jgi:glycosyltransferase involved in cell wall biosynthesis
VILHPGGPRTVLLLHSSAGLYGADQQLLTIARGLDAGRWRALCVLPERGPLAALLEEAGAEVVVHPLAVLRRALATPRGGAAMAAGVRRDRRVLGRLARERGVALVHDNTSVVLGGHAVARAAGAAHLVHVREIWRDAAGRPGRLLWPVVRRRILRADGVACISEAVARQFPAGATTLVRDGLPRVPGRVGRPEARRRLGLAADSFVVALVGRIHPWKGQDVLVRALADPRLARAGAVALLAGDALPGTGREELLDAQARELGVADRVVRLGFREDVDDVLGAADALVVPSTLPEPLGLVALEGAAAGLPVVASDAGGLPEVVDDGRTGLLVPPGDPGALAAALARLAGDARAAAAMGAAGAEEVRGRFTAERMVGELDALYERLVR